MLPGPRRHENTKKTFFLLRVVLRAFVPSWSPFCDAAADPAPPVSRLPGERQPGPAPQPGGRGGRGLRRDDRLVPRFGCGGVAAGGDGARGAPDRRTGLHLVFVR